MALDTKRIRSVLDELARADPGEAWRFRTNATWSEQRLAELEAKHLRLPADYRAWLRDVGDGGIGAGFLDLPRGMRALASQTESELALAAEPFGVEDDSAEPPEGPVSGALHLGEDAQSCPWYLVTSGARAGEIWINGDGWGDSLFFRHGTFAELTEAWIDAVVQDAKAQLAPRDPAELEAIAPEDRFGHVLSSGLVPWLRSGPAIFAEAFAHVAAPNRPGKVDRFVRCIETEERWLHDPALARVAAEALAAVLARAEEPGDALDHALDAMYDPDPPDVAPEKVSALLEAIAARVGQPDDRLDPFTGRWLQHELARAGRVEEATRVFRHRIGRTVSDWAELARDLFAVGRADVAFAIADEVPYGPSGKHWGKDDRDRVRAWMHLEAGDRDSAIAWMERHVARCESCAPELARLRSNDALESPPDLTPTVVNDSRTCVPMPFVRPRARRGQRHHELVALLYGVAGDGERMASSALASLSRPELTRNPSEHVIHRAHLRMGRALAGHGEAEREVLAVHYGAGVRVRLARAILARTGEIGVRLEGA